MAAIAFEYPARYSVTALYVNKGVYKLEDLPPAYQAEVRPADCGNPERKHRRAIAGACRTAEPSHVLLQMVRQRPARASPMCRPSTRSMISCGPFGVSVFNKKNSTSKHFGPIRATIRVLYNINDMNDRSAYIWCGDTTSYWKDDKLFIFDDTLMHPGESDRPDTLLPVRRYPPSVLHTGFFRRHHFFHGHYPEGQQFDLLQELEGYPEVSRALSSPHTGERKPAPTYPGQTPPVCLLTLSTIRLVKASRSSSFNVRSCGWIETSMATDFLSSPSEAPSNRSNT